METKINIINVPTLKDADIQRSYIFNNNFRFEVGDNLSINCIIHVDVPIGEQKVTEYGTSQQYESKRINKDCYIHTIINDITYNVNNNGIVCRTINVKISDIDEQLIHKYISSESLAERIDFES